MTGSCAFRTAGLVGAVVTFATASMSAGGATSAQRAGSGFGSAGEVLTSFGLKSEARAVALQSDGKIVVAGERKAAFALARYTPDGTLDTAFGTGGMVVTDDGARSGTDLWNQRGATGVAIQTDGRIVAVGASRGLFVVVRYLSDGRLDQSFGTRGIVKTAFGARTGRGGDAFAQAVAVQRDGKIVVAGRSNSVFALVRFTPTGGLDRSFGTGGKVRTDAGPDDFDTVMSLGDSGERQDHRSRRQRSALSRVGPRALHRDRPARTRIRLARRSRLAGGRASMRRKVRRRRLRRRRERARKLVHALRALEALTK